MLFVVLSLFLTEPAPLEMPRAEAYLVREDGARRLEDRYDRTELWLSQTVTGRWIDEAGRSFVLAELAFCPPAVTRATVTRAGYAAARTPMKRVRANADFPQPFREAVALLSSCAVVEKPRSPRQLPHGFKEVYYWQHPTNYTDIVCTFLPLGTNLWYYASWTLAQEDDYAERMQAFEDQFLRREFRPLVASLPPRASHTSQTPIRERAYLSADMRHAVAAYANWHFTGPEEFAVIDDLPSRGFVETLTNDFAVMRGKYAAALPTSLDGSNVLSVIRMYASRDEYLDALEANGITNMDWSAAYWCSERREIVAHLSSRGEEELLRTIRHEACHQYLSYATGLCEVSPWLNEGYAQYFEDESREDWNLPFEVTEENLERLGERIPALLLMDTEMFYSGSDQTRLVNYRLAWSVVRFLEKGAPEVRLKPFAGLKKAYLDTLVETRDMRRATAAAFVNADTLKLFVWEWKKFWKKR